jgi:NAD(P)-dependent dehydrogenase (short-subunit alcohol dehydrogenase family)
MRLAGKVTLVTGAGSGIGRAIATCFASEGAAVGALDVDPADAASTAAAIAAAGGRGLALVADVTRAPEVEAAIARCVDTFGGLDVLVNSAGILGPVGSVVDAPEAAWDRLFAVNVKGPYLCARYAVPAMRRRGGGAIVNLASTAGLVGSPVLGPYSASKGAVVLMTRSMALAHAPERIRVNCLCPGSIETPMLEAMFTALPTPEQQATLREATLRRHPLGRLGRADEVARAALYLASEEASFITGVALPVDGGRIA